MKEVSKKFPAVMTTKEVLGIPEGTILQFDWSSGKYVSVTETEEIADDYYYSGFAVALDPYIVKDNVGTYFTHIEQDEPVKEPEPVEVPKVEKKSKAKKVKVEDQEPPELKSVVYEEKQVFDATDKPQPKVEVKEEDETPYPGYGKKHALVNDCSCGHRNLLQVIEAPGINLTLMAEQEDSRLILACRECGATLKLWFAPDSEVTNELIEKKSK